ncbi:MAG TPA: hypothetical protein VFD71_21815 [Planctomycetota bacterium]|nr:hypothetical protein [Planctomycetota bacterium]
MGVELPAQEAGLIGPRPPAGPRYIARLTHVREVSLRGSADLAFWERRLRSEGLAPVPRAAKAEIVVLAAAARFAGKAFTEVSFSVAASEMETAEGTDGVFLIQAFNSSRLLTFCERVFFSTPYVHAECFASASAPVQIRVAMRGGAVFSAQQGSGDEQGRDLSRKEVERSELSIFLPRTRPHKGRRGGMFHALLEGPLRTYAFQPGADTMILRPPAGPSPIRDLVESGFAAEEWSVREDGEHARSATRRRNCATPR